MSFQSPDRKQESGCNKNFSLLNYMIFKEKELKIVGVDKKINKLAKDQFSIL